jgi:hypothetical protein
MMSFDASRLSTNRCFLASPTAGGETPCAEPGGRSRSHGRVKRANLWMNFGGDLDEIFNVVDRFGAKAGDSAEKALDASRGMLLVPLLHDHACCEAE